MSQTSRTSIARLVEPGKENLDEINWLDFCLLGGAPADSINVCTPPTLLPDVGPAMRPLIRYSATVAFVLISLNVQTLQAQTPEQRWSANGKGGSPSFTRHVVPLMTKLGCNNRSCHGSFQGKGDFRLSLFGYEPEMDYKQIRDSRLDLKTPEESLFLLKPLTEVSHKGKKRFDKGSWQHRLLKQWIDQGAKYPPKDEPQLAKLEIVPAKIRFTKTKSVQLRTIAHFTDGSHEEITPLTTFSSNDDSVAQVSEGGLLQVQGTGGTSIVAKYGSGIATTPVIVPVAGSKPFPSFPPQNRIDVHVAQHLKRLGIHPSGLCEDEAFLRRVHVDLIGTLPTLEEVRKFLADDHPDKRARLVDSLLARPEYGLYWATLFSDWMGNNQGNINNFFKMTWLFHSWIRDKLEKNVPFDQFVTGIVTATSREGRSLKEYLAENKIVQDKIAPREGFDLELYANRKTLDLYWMRRVPDRPKELAIRTANAFLGIQIQCAQCHNHPFDRWTKSDFEGFTSFFRVVDICDLDGSPRSKGRYDYDKVALYPGAPKREVGMLKKHPPKLLGGSVVPFSEKGKDPRQNLASWMTAKENPYFARNIVNRLWHHYFGVGIVDPVDDLNEANPPSNPELLDWLAEDFIAHGYDLKHLHRRILTSRTYQLSHVPNESNRTDQRHFSHVLVRRMPAEVALDALAQVTKTELRWNTYAAPRGARAIGMATPVRAGRGDYFLQIFGRPKRQQTCACERTNESSLTQALFLLNDEDLLKRVNAPEGRLLQLLKEQKDNAKVVEELYLTCLSRYPTAEERKKIADYVSGAASRREAMEDVLWSLLNTREFIFVH